MPALIQLVGVLLLPAQGVRAAEKQSGIWENGILTSGTKTSCSIDLDRDDSGAFCCESFPANKAALAIDLIFVVK